VHFDIILVNDQLDALFLNVFISRFYMFRAQVLIIRRAKVYYTSSGITHFLLTGTPDSHPPECVIPDDVLIQFDPPDDEHLCSKHVQAWNKCIKKERVKLVINQK
jgi:hypothetical protein